MANIPPGGPPAGWNVPPNRLGPPPPNWPSLNPLVIPQVQGPIPFGPGLVQPAPGSPIVVPMSTSQGRLYKLTVEPRQEPVLGWRRYELLMQDNRLLLRGARVNWPEATLVAVCEMDLDTQIFTCLTDNFGDKGAKVFAAYAKAYDQEQPSGQVACEEHIRSGYCQCGIYGGVTPEDTMGSGMVMAKCTAWGYVAMDELGNWKATSARIEAVFLLKSAVSYAPFFDWAMVTRELRERYDCPVFVVEDEDEIPR